MWRPTSFTCEAGVLISLPKSSISLNSGAIGKIKPKTLLKYEVDRIGFLHFFVNVLVLHCF